MIRFNSLKKILVIGKVIVAHIYGGVFKIPVSNNLHCVCPEGFFQLGNNKKNEHSFAQVFVKPRTKAN